MYRFVHQWNIQSLAIKFGLKSCEITKALRDFKKLSKLHGRTDSESKPKQRKFKNEHVLWIKEYVDNKATKYFTAAHI